MSSMYYAGYDYNPAFVAPNSFSTKLGEQLASIVINYGIDKTIDAISKTNPQKDNWKRTSKKVANASLQYWKRKRSRRITNLRYTSRRKKQYRRYSNYRRFSKY